jgi:phospholipase C
MHARDLLPWVLIGALSAACSGSDEPTEEPEAPRPTDQEAALAREACAFRPGALPSATLGASDPVGARIPVDHVIILMMENRSFDHYFSKLPEYGLADVRVADESFENLDATGTPVKWHKTDGARSTASTTEASRTAS